MSKLHGAGPGEGPAHGVQHEELEPELREFASRTPSPPIDAGFRDELRTQLWELLLAVVARLRGR
jgi:hypothetical protein